MSPLFELTSAQRPPYDMVDEDHIPLTIYKKQKSLEMNVLRRINIINHI
jgi:hypothetical protein